jgi:hypothetical protein
MASLRLAAQTPTFASGVQLGDLQPMELEEASGLAASRQNPGVLWSHNDNDTPGVVFALSTNGALLGRYTVPGVFSGDFEDIAVGPGPWPEYQYVYLGDIGDNDTNRASIRVFRFPEPAVWAYQSANPRHDALAGAQTITLRYPDRPYDAEALLVDPRTGDLFVATKQSNGSRIYRATRAQLDSGQPVTLAFVRQVTSSTVRDISAGDVSHDGQLVALRREGAAWLWVRQPGQSVGDVFTNSRVTIPVAGTSNEPNGEALGFHPTGLDYYTVSEGVNEPLYFFRRTDPGVPRQPLVLIARGETWRYQDAGTDEGVAWRQPAFNDSGWASGLAQLGYGQGDERTTISFGPNPSAKHVTTYFRKAFTLAAGTMLTNVALRVCFTDGLAVYLNGTEIVRINLPPNPAFDAPASASNAAFQNHWHSFPVPPALLRTGTNVVAVELHRQDPAGPDLSFDAQLVEAALETSPQFTTLPQRAGGFWQIGLAGPAGSLVTVEASQDLSSWSAAGQVVLTNGTGLFQESATPARAHRFYRIGRP